jgi:small subunit ribosomal protein MRP21
MKQNNVFREVRMQERHEKKGYKRRRLASERWRRRFAHEVCSDRLFVREVIVNGLFAGEEEGPACE